jgi:hypothetical protein
LGQRKDQLKRTQTFLRDIIRPWEFHEAIRQVLLQLAENFPDADLAIDLYDNRRKEADSEYQNKYLADLRKFVEAKAWVDFLESSGLNSSTQPNPS